MTPGIFLCEIVPLTIVEIDFLLLCCFSYLFHFVFLSSFSLLKMFCFVFSTLTSFFYGYSLISSLGSNHYSSCILSLPLHLALPFSSQFFCPIFLPSSFYPHLLSLTGCIKRRCALQQGQANWLAICLRIKFYKHSHTHSFMCIIVCGSFCKTKAELNIHE